MPGIGHRSAVILLIPAFHNNPFGKSNLQVFPEYNDWSLSLRHYDLIV